LTVDEGTAAKTTVGAAVPPEIGGLVTVGIPPAYPPVVPPVFPQHPGPPPAVLGMVVEVVVGIVVEVVVGIVVDVVVGIVVDVVVVDPDSSKMMFAEA
jgi:hypothetical protein